MSPAAVIRGIEYALPRRVVTNEDLQRDNPAWDMAWIAGKTGVLSRRFSGDDELASDLGTIAAEKVLTSRGVAREEVEALIVCTITPDHPTPPNSLLLHERLKLGPETACLDFTHTCSGYVYGLAVARAFIESGHYRRVLLVTGDTFSRICHPRDRSTYTLCGDAVAATLIELAGEGGEAGRGIVDIRLGSDGRGARRIYTPAGAMREPRSAETAAERTDVFGNVRSRENFHMNGAAALAFARKTVPAAVGAILHRNRLSLSDVKTVFLHQASRVILTAVEKELGLTPEKIFSNLAEIGNTTSASLPILLRDAQSEGRLRPGDLVLLVSFGAGFSWGTCLMRA